MRRTTFTARLGLVSIAMAGIALLAAPEAKSGSKTSVAEDPEGDAFILSNFVEPQRAPDYMDLIRSEVSLRGGIFIFKLTVAGPVPDEPFLNQTQNGVLAWSFLIDTDPATFPVGGPGFPPATPLRQEFIVVVEWGGTDFTAILIDRRPGLVGEDAIITPIPFDIDGNELSVSVSRRMLDYPRSFGWHADTALFPSFGENASFLPFDRVPDAEDATWPAE